MDTEHQLEVITQHLEELQDLIDKTYCETFELAWLPVTHQEAVKLLGQKIIEERQKLKEMVYLISPSPNSIKGPDWVIEGNRLWSTLKAGGAVILIEDHDHGD